MSKGGRKGVEERIYLLLARDFDRVKLLRGGVSPGVGYRTVVPHKCVVLYTYCIDEKHPFSPQRRHKHTHTHSGAKTHALSYIQGTKRQPAINPKTTR